MPLSTRKSVLSGLVSLCALAGMLLLSPVALAAPPEAPETKAATGVTATTATLNGVLNPNAAGEPGEYAFLYEISATECAAGIAAPEPAGIALGFKEEAVAPVEVTGLQPNAQYTFCLFERNAAGETTIGPSVSFTTLAAKPTVDSENASTVNSTGATLEAQVNPNNQETTFTFEYSLTEMAGKLTGTILTLPGSEPLAPVYGDQTASVPTGAVLQPGTTYFYRVVATNATGTTDGTVQPLTTVPVPNTDATTAVTATTAMFNGHLMLDTVDTQYYFNYNAGSECAGGSSTVLADAGTGAGSASQATEVTGLTPHTQYTVCLVATNAFGSEQGTPVTFTTQVALPTIENESVANVTGDSADLDAELNPGGGETTYHFDYGTTSSYGQSTPESLPVGEDDTNHPAAAHVQGLQSGTVYHYRIVVTNTQSPAGGTLGPDETFTTQPAATQFTLPDGRQYELVSPANKDGGEVTLRWSGLQSSVASADGTKVVYLADIPFAHPTASGRDTQILSIRGPQGWSSQNISPPHSEPTDVGEGFTEFRAFSSDLSRAIVHPLGPTALSPLDMEGYSTMYLRDNSNGSYQPLFTRDPEGLPYEAFTQRVGEEEFYVQLTDGTPDLSHFVLESQFGLTENSSRSIKPQYPNLYEWIDGHLQLISVDDKGLSTGGDDFVAISDDGSHVLMDNNQGELFVRNVTTQETISVGGSVKAISGGTPWETVISRDGSKVFFRKEAPNFEDRQIYEFDLDSTSPKPVQVSDEPGREMREILGVSADGSHVYYTDELGNIFVAHSDGATWVSTLIKTGGVQTGVSLDTGPLDLISQGRSQLYPEATVTSNGRLLAFTSLADQEVYLYDAGSGRLICTSCNRTGARPLGPSALASFDEDGRMFFNSNDALVAHDTNGLQDVYEWEPEGIEGCRDSLGCQYLISSGTGDGDSTLLGASANGDDVFFMARDRLVAQDFDNSFDVYDAHVCTTAEPCPVSSVSPPPCRSSDACKAPPSPQPAVFGAPPTATFSGAGNVTTQTPAALKPRPKSIECKKGFSRRHGKCVKHKRKKRAKKARSTRSTMSLSAGAKR